MKKEFCIAATRLIYDVVGADGYVTNRELDILDESLYPKYHLNDLSIYHEAMHHTLCEALHVVRNWKVADDIEGLKSDLELLAGVGGYGGGVNSIMGYCSRKEAWLLLALSYALRRDTLLFSFGNSDFRFSRSEIIYLENQYHQKFNDEMRAKHKMFQAQLNEYGIRLIYIPQVRDYLKEKRRVRKLIKLMRYVNPFKRYEDSDAQKIANDIDEIQTSDFARDFLSSNYVESHEHNLFEQLTPSFLLKVGTSVVACDEEHADHIGKPQGLDCSGDVVKESKKRKSDFILIPIKESIEATLNEAFSIFSGYTLEQSLTLKRLPNAPFILHGFDRTFLHFAMNRMLAADRLTDISFDFYHLHQMGKTQTYTVSFTFDNKRTIHIPLANKSMCLYLLILIYTNQDKKNGIPYYHPRKDKEPEEVLRLIGKRAKARYQSMYSKDGTLALDLNHIHEKMKSIPAPYHVIRSHDGQHLIVNFPYRDIVHINLDGQSHLLWDYIEEMRAKNRASKIGTICREMFN